MRPPTTSSRTSSAPTARSSAWRCTRVARRRPAAGRQRPALRARPRRVPARPVGVERDGERHPVRTVRGDESLRDALSELLPSPLELGAVVDGDGRVQGVLDVDLIHDAARARRAVERGRVSAADDPRPGRATTSSATARERRQLRRQQRLLPGLDRPTTSTATCRPSGSTCSSSSSRSASASRSRSRSRCSPTAGAGSSARSPRSRGSSTRSPASRSSSCCCRSPGAATRRRSSR